MSKKLDNVIIKMRKNRLKNKHKMSISKRGLNKKYSIMMDSIPEKIFYEEQCQYYSRGLLS